MKAQEVIAMFSGAKFLARHGDVVIVSDETAVMPPVDAEGVLAYGEVTGHAHRVSNIDAKRIADDLIQRTLAAGPEAFVDHEELQKKPIPEGKHRSSILKVWDVESVLRPVLD